MDHIRSVSLSCRLDSNCSEAALDLPDFELSALEGVDLCMNARVLPPEADLVGYAIRPRLTLSIGGTDCTDAFFEAVCTQLDNDLVARAQYDAAARNRITSLERSGYYWRRGVSASEQADALTRLPQQGLKHVFRGCDFSATADGFGVLHPANYAYQSVHLRPVPLLNLGLHDFSELQASPDIRVSASPTAYQIEVCVQIYLRYVDPLLDEIKTKLESLQTDLISINDKLVSLDERMTEISTDIGTTNAALIGVEASAKAISLAADEIVKKHVVP